MTDAERKVIENATYLNLGGAISQMGDSDDKIICDRVREAYRKLNRIADEFSLMALPPAAVTGMGKVSPSRTNGSYRYQRGPRAWKQKFCRGHSGKRSNRNCRRELLAERSQMLRNSEAAGNRGRGARRSCKYLRAIIEAAKIQTSR